MIARFRLVAGFLSGLALSQMFVAPPSQAAECDACVRTLVCNFRDECVLFEHCDSVWGHGSVNCWVDIYGCHESGERCLWAELSQPELNLPYRSELARDPLCLAQRVSVQEAAEAG